MDKIPKREREDYVTQLYVQSSAIIFLSAGSYNLSELVALRLAEMTAWHVGSQRLTRSSATAAE